MPIPVFERSEKEIAQLIRRRVKSLRGVEDCSGVSMGFTRKKLRTELHVTLKGNPGYEETHAICSTIDRQVRHTVPNARVATCSRTSALEESDQAFWHIVKGIADGEPGSRGALNIHLIEVNGKVGVDLLLLEAETQAARKPSSRTEMEIAQKLKAADSRISEVVIHRESVAGLVVGEWSGHGVEARCYVEHVAKHFPSIRLFDSPVIRTIGDRLHVRIRIVPISTIGQEGTSEVASKLTAAIKNGYHAITKVDIIEGHKDSASGMM